MRFNAEHTKNAEERREKNSKGNGENSFGVPASAGPGRVNAELQTFLPQENPARQPPQKNRADFFVHRGE
jgi:hypothetical protein